MKVSFLITTLALYTFFSVSAQPYGIDTIESMQKKKASCIALSEEKEEEIKIIVQKLTDHLHQVMQEHNKFDFKLIKLSIEEHKDTHINENDTVLQIIVNDCARENEDETETDEKLNRNDTTKAEPKKIDEEAKKHDLSSVGNKDSKTQPNYEINNRPTDLTKNNEQPSKLNYLLMPFFNHGEANPDKKPTMTNLTDSTKPLSNNHGPDFGKKSLPTDKKDTVLNGPKKTNENTDKLEDTKKSLFNNHGPNFGKKPLATNKTDNVTNHPKKNSENVDKLKDTIKPLSNNHGANFGKQPLATDKKENVTNGFKKENENIDKLKDTIKPLSSNHSPNFAKQLLLSTDKRDTVTNVSKNSNENTDTLKDTINPPSNEDGAKPEKNEDSKPGEIDKKKDAVDGIIKKIYDKQNNITKEKNIEKEAKITEIEPKPNQKNESHPEIKKIVEKENVTKPKDEEQTKKPGPRKNETRGGKADDKSEKKPKEDDNRDKKLTQLKLPESAEKLLKALEKNQPKGKPIWVYVEDKEDKKKILFV